MSSTPAAVHTLAPYTAGAGAELDTTQLQGRLKYWEVLPNMRIGTFSHYRENNERVFSTLGGSCLCVHGECGGSIRTWRKREKTKNIARLSTCTCLNSQGLERIIRADLPPAPESMFELFKSCKAARVVIPGASTVHAYETPLRCESGAVALSSSGDFHCAHGHLFVIKRMPLARSRVIGKFDSTKKQAVRRRFTTGKCPCLLVLPNRPSFPEVPLARRAVL